MNQNNFTNDIDDFVWDVKKIHLFKILENKKKKSFILQHLETILQYLERYT